MRFTYTYRSSDGQRHTGEIEAESRDAAFARLRAEFGIKPIKVVAAGGGDGRDGARPDMKRRDAASPRGWARLVAAGVLAAIAGGVWWWFGGRRATALPAAQPAASGEVPAAHDDQPITVATPQGPVTLAVAAPLPRQTIPGNRQRVEGAAATFTHPAEAWLARYAEPGRAVEGRARPSPEEFEACLKEPIRIASTDFTEAVDLKRIVTGMKREMRAYLAGGGTVEGYLAELERRQRLEISYRENAERRLKELLDARDDDGRDGARPEMKRRDAASPSGEKRGDGGSDEAQQPLKEAYDYWLKANAQLQAMGIYPLALPDALRSYQMSLGIDE